MKKFLAATLTCALLLAGLLACTATPGGRQVDLSAFAKTLQEKYEFASYLMEMTPDYEYYEDDMERTYPGLLEMDLEQKAILMTLISINGGEISLVQAKNADDAAKVAELFQARIDYMAGEGDEIGGAFYPGPTELWRNYAQVVTKGNYVMLVVGDDYEQIVEEFNALF